MFSTPPKREDWDSELPQHDDGGNPGCAASPAPVTTKGVYDLSDVVVAPSPLPSRAIAEQMWLVDFPRNEMVVTCQTCGKVQRYRTHRLIAEHGWKETISEVLALKSQDCECGVSGDCELVLMAEPA